MIFLVIFRDDLALLFNLAWTDASSLERCSNFFWKSSSAPKIPLHSRETTPMRGCFPPFDEFAGSTTAAVAASSTTISRRERGRVGCWCGGGEEGIRWNWTERETKNYISRSWRIQEEEEKRQSRSRSDRRTQLWFFSDWIGKRRTFLFRFFRWGSDKNHRHRPAGEKKANRVLSGQEKETDPRKRSAVSRAWSWQLGSWSKLIEWLTSKSGR